MIGYSKVSKYFCCCSCHWLMQVCEMWVLFGQGLRLTYFLFCLAELLLAPGRLEKTTVHHESAWWCISWNYLVGSLHITFVCFWLSCWVFFGDWKTAVLHELALWWISWNYLVGLLHLFGQGLRIFCTLPTQFMDSVFVIGWIIYFFGQGLRVFL